MITDEKEQIKQYNRFITNRLFQSVKSKETELSDSLRRYTLNSMQQYRTRYLLAKISQYVDMAYKGLKKPGHLREYTSLEIEHILPNTPNDELRMEFESRNHGFSYDDCKIMLGNLTLLEKPINIVTSNDYFSNKCVEYKKSKCYLTSSIAEINIVGNNSSINRINSKLKSYTDWTATSIEDRQELLSNLVKEIWKIEEYM